MPVFWWSREKFKDLRFDDSLYEFLGAKLITKDALNAQKKRCSKLLSRAMIIWWWSRRIREGFTDIYKFMMNDSNLSLSILTDARNEAEKSTDVSRSISW